MKERFEIYDGSEEAKKAKGKSKNLSGFHPLFTAAANRCRSGVGAFGASDRRSDLLRFPG